MHQSLSSDEKMFLVICFLCSIIIWRVVRSKRKFIGLSSSNFSVCLFSNTTHPKINLGASLFSLKKHPIIKQTKKQLLENFKSFIFFSFFLLFLFVCLFACFRMVFYPFSSIIILLTLHGTFDIDRPNSKCHQQLLDKI